MYCSFEGDIERLIQRFIPPHKAPAFDEPRAPPFRADIARIDRYAPAELIGREDEMAGLADAWEKARRERQGGARDHLRRARRRGEDVAGGGVAGGARRGRLAGVRSGVRLVLLQPGDARANGGVVGPVLDKRRWCSSAIQRWRERPDWASKRGGGWPSSGRSGGRCLVLDGVEPLQHPPGIAPGGQNSMDPGVSALLKALAAQSRGLCVVTTRYSIADLRELPTEHRARRRSWRACRARPV